MLEHRALVGALTQCPAGDIDIFLRTPVDEAEGCPVDSMYYAEHCGETYCGGPDVEVGTGFDRFIELDEGDELSCSR